MGGKTLGEDISQLINCRDEFDSKIFAKNSFSHKMKVNFNMLGYGMEDWIGSNC